MSGFFLFIIIALMVAVSVLGMALLSWVIKRLLSFFFAKVAASKESNSDDEKDVDVEKGQVPVKRRSSTTTADSLSLDDDDVSFMSPENVPMVTIQFLAAHDQAALHDFLKDLESRIHYPVSKLEILLCVKEDASNDNKTNNKKTSSASKKRPLPHGLSQDNYNLILDRMEDGFHILVVSSQEDLLDHPPRGSLLFTFDSIADIPSPAFLQDYLVAVE